MPVLLVALMLWMAPAPGAPVHADTPPPIPSEAQFVLGWTTPVGTLDRPGALTVGPRGEGVWVIDGGNHRLQAFAGDGAFLDAWGHHGEGEGRLAGPTDVSIGPRGEMWIADEPSSKVQRVAPDGTVERSFSGASLSIGRPVAVASRPDGGAWLADGATDRIVHVDPDGRVRAAFGRGGLAPGELNGVRDIVVAPDGTLLTLEAYRVQRWTTTGRWVDAFGERGTAAGDFQDAAALAVDGSGRIYVADRGASRVTRFSEDGGLQATWDDGLRAPSGIAVTTEPTVWVSDAASGAIARFTPVGRPLRSVGQPDRSAGHLAVPLDLAFDADGDLWITDGRDGQIERMGLEDARFITHGVHGGEAGELGFPDGIATGGSGEVVVADTANQQIVRFTTDGARVGVQPGWGPSARPVVSGVAVAKDGSVLATDKKGRRVARYGDRSGWPTPWTNPEAALRHPAGIALIADGGAWVTDWWLHRLIRLDADGTVTLRVGMEGEEPGALQRPEGVALDAWSRVYVADSRNHRIQMFTDRGEFAAVWGSEGAGPDGFGASGPAGIAWHDGTLAVVDRDGGRVLVFGATPETPWRTEWFSDRWLSSVPVGVEQHGPAELDLAWSDVPDDFEALRTARWIPPSDTARIVQVEGDGGIRMWVGDRLIVDAWQATGIAVGRPIPATDQRQRIVVESRRPPGGAAEVRALSVRLVDAPGGSVVYLPRLVAGEPVEP